MLKLSTYVKVLRQSLSLTYPQIYFRKIWLTYVSLPTDLIAHKLSNIISDET